MWKMVRILIVIFIALILSVFNPTGSNLFEGALNMKVYAEEQGINQSASTSGGTVKRYIDMSSPFSGGYLHEDMKVVGRASITESFTMDNISPGSKADANTEDWIFGPSGNSSASNKEMSEDSGSSEGNSSAGSDNSSASNSSESSKVAAEEKASPPKEAVLGINIISYPTWLDLF